MASCAAALMQENIWVDRFRVQDAETVYHQALAAQRSGLVVQSATNQSSGGGDDAGSDLINEIVRARENIKNSLNDGVGLKIGVNVDNPELQARLSAVEQENTELKKVTASLQASVAELTARVNALEKAAGGVPAAPAASAAKAAPAQEEEDEGDDDDDDFELFGDDDDDEEVEKLKEERKKEAEAMKKPKKTVIAKSSIILDVKPWDDETDMAEVERCVRTLETDGLLWGAAKLVAVGYGIKKLQIMCVVEDDKVGTDYLEEGITAFEELVQSVDIVAFNKI